MKFLKTITAFLAAVSLSTVCAAAAISESYNASGEKKIIISAPDCVVVNGTRMIRVAELMRYYGMQPIWNADTKTVDFYSEIGHIRVKVGSSYVDYSGEYVDWNYNVTKQTQLTAFTTQPNQIINGSVYVDEAALRNYIMNDVILKP